MFRRASVPGLKLAGQECNETQRRLCELEGYTGIYKRRFDVNKHAGVMPNDSGSGDICANPIRAIRMEPQSQ